MDTQSSSDQQRQLYITCIQKQLDEADMLSSIYCNPGEMKFFDPGVISDFSEYMSGHLPSLRSQLDFSISISTQNNEKIEIRIELPHLYPLIENAIVTVRSALLSKSKESSVKAEIEQFIDSLDKSEPYVFQVISWIQENIDEFMQREEKKEEIDGVKNTLVEFERLWIYSHHLKSKTKRQEIVRQANDLDLTGFSRPGKPGVICVEGLKAHTQDFWKHIKGMHWQKITIRKSEVKQKAFGEIDKLRRWPTFKEEMFSDMADEEGIKMNMALFIKYLEMHNSGYIKKDLFGLE